jgi:S-(hydroxymethyl)glutathione dehydrogenase/alcohol dehydrogenase
MLRKGGVATIVGVMPPGTMIEVSADELFWERRLQSSIMGDGQFRRDIPRYLDLYREGRLKLDELVSARIKLDEINDGFDVMRNGDVARSVIVF